MGRLGPSDYFGEWGPLLSAAGAWEDAEMEAWGCPGKAAVPGTVWAVAVPILQDPPWRAGLRAECQTAGTQSVPRAPNSLWGGAGVGPVLVDWIRK